MKEFLLSLKDYLPYIALLFSILAAIFRNQLAKVGDSLSAKGREIGEYTFIILFSLIVIGGPVYMIIYGRGLPLTHYSVLWMIGGISLLVFNFNMFSITLFMEGEKKKHKAIYDTIEQLEQKLDEKIEAEKNYNKERTKVLKYYTDIVVRIERLKHSDNVDMKELEELQSELEEAVKKYSHVQI